MHARTFFAVAAALLFAGALVHVACLIGGPGWMAFVGAPPAIVESSRAGTWLAPVTTLGITALLMVLALYALSAGGSVRRLPFVRTMLALFAAIFVLRGLIVVPALLQGRLNWSATFDLFIITSSAAIFAIGAALTAGLLSLYLAGRGKRPT